MGELSTSKDTSVVEKTKRRYVDGRESWWMAVASVLAFFVCMGFTRADGVMFVALMQEQGTSRETASWPFNLAGAAVVFMAPVTGILSSRFSPLAIGLCGSLLFAAGYSACFFSTEIYYLSICLGIIKGSGQAMVITIIPTLINHCFDRHRATAMGIATTGTPLGGFVLPLLVQYLLEEYGLKGTFLILGGIALHAALGSSVYVFYPRAPSPSYREPSKNTTGDFCASEKTHLLANCSYPTPCAQKNQKSSANLALRRIKTIFGSRGFYFVAINQIISLQLVETFSLVVVDYSVDKGVSQTKAVLLITITSGVEILGRLGFGWVTDKKFLSRPVYMMTCQTLSAGLVLLFSFSYEYYLLAIFAAFLGMIQGSALSVTHVVFSDYLKKEEIALAVAFARSFHGLASLARSPIIGYFRDYLGSYDLLFLSVSLVFLGGGIMWFCESLFLCCKRRREKMKDSYERV